VWNVNGRKTYEKGHFTHDIDCYTCNGTGEVPEAAQSVDRKELIKTLREQAEVMDEWWKEDFRDSLNTAAALISRDASALEALRELVEFFKQAAVLGQNFEHSRVNIGQITTEELRGLLTRAEALAKEGE